MIISNIRVGERLDRFLTEQVPTLSRTTIQQHIQSGSIIVNNSTVAKHYFLKTGDVVTIPEAVLAPQQMFTLAPNDQLQIDVITERPDYIIINKPAGLIVHPGDGHLQNDTLVNGLLFRYPELSAVGDHTWRPGIVHRLDKNVSGVMVIARTQTMYELLKQQFQNRSVIKKYTALVHGVLSESTGEITLSIGRSLRDRKKMAAHPPTEVTDISSKPAYTQYAVIQQFQHYALVSVQILTGRTHQIRVHFNAIGHPIVGDQVYKPRKLKSRLLVNRIFLHAHALAFNDSTGTAVAVQYEVPLSVDLQDIVDELYRTL